MKRRYMLYAVAIAGLGAAVLSDQLAPAAEAVVQPVARTAQQLSQTPAVPTHRDSARAPDATPSDVVLALVARNDPGRSADPGSQATAFSAHSWKPVVSAAAAAASEPAPPSEPPFSYIGRQPVKGGWEVFIAEKNIVQTVKVDDLIDDQYKVLNISATEMTLEYVPMHIKFSMSLE